MPATSRRRDQRSLAQLREHYEIEKQLADRLRNAPRDERRHLYRSVYDELFRRVPHHPNMTRKVSTIEAQRAVQHELGFLRRFLNSDTVFLEVGPGACALSIEVSKWVRQVYAVDVSVELTAGLELPDNCSIVLSDGCSIPVASGSIGTSYSHQLMEHLHPDDALEQLCNIQRALVPGGVYVCITPNRLYGPTDISRYFDSVPTGFHLKEYTISELHQLFVQAGFGAVAPYVGTNGIYLQLPLPFVESFEGLFSRLTYRARRLLARNRVFRGLLGIRLVGTK